MANVLVEEQYLSNIGSAIRGWNGLTTTYMPSQMPAAISAISLSGNITVDMVAERKISGEVSGTASFIYSSAFLSCSTLTAANFPNCTAIYSSAFCTCVALTTANFPNCTLISSNAFYSCYALTTASFPKCTLIGSYAFRNCYNLISVYLNNVSQVTAINASVFYSTPIGGYSTSAGRYGSVFVPSSLYNSFITATNWASMSDRIVSM